MSKPAKRPWKWDGDDLWHFGAGYEDAHDPHNYTGISIKPELRDSPQLKANMELVVRAVNCHDDLLAACEAAFAFNMRADMSLSEHVFRGAELNKQIKAAIAKAGGPQ